jgi:hypothetical protein
MGKEVACQAIQHPHDYIYIYIYIYSKNKEQGHNGNQQASQLPFQIKKSER